MSLKPIFFPSQLHFREWLSEHHTTATELFIGYHKVGTGKQGMTYSESVDQALCFGWIDGVRRSIDSVSYCNRFTPRKAKSNWSTVNIAKVAKLLEDGHMEPAGMAAFEKREEPGSLSAEYFERFQADMKAWNFFEQQGNWYKEQKISWITTAKQEATREARLEKLIQACAKGSKI